MALKQWTSEIIPEIRKFSSLPEYSIEKKGVLQKTQGANLWGLPAACRAPANPVLEVRPALDRRAVPDHQAAAIMIKAHHIAARAARAELKDPRAAELGFLATGCPDGAPSGMRRLEAVGRRVWIAKAQGRHYGERGRQWALTRLDIRFRHRPTPSTSLSPQKTRPREWLSVQSFHFHRKREWRGYTVKKDNQSLP